MGGFLGVVTSAGIWMYSVQHPSPTVMFVATASIALPWAASDFEQMMREKAHKAREAKKDAMRAGVKGFMSAIDDATSDKR